MKSFFKELFDYNFNCNQQLLKVVIRQPDQVSEKIIRVQSHIANAHAIWNGRIVSAQLQVKPWDLHSPEALLHIDAENHKNSLAILEQYDLNQPVNYALSSGKAFTNNVRDLLFHIINHSTYHRGQVASEFRQSQLEPLMTDWIIYKMQGN